VIRVLVSHELLAETFDQLRVCGDGRRECVVYWTSATEEPNRVTEVVHPQHTASALGYEVDSAWVNALFLDLRRRRRTVRVQVHTHPGRASHSEVDDEFALAPATGFISLVLPDFAAGAPGLAETHAVVMKPDGAWKAVPPSDLLAVEH
jgi:hypothetical protein